MKKIIPLASVIILLGCSSNSNIDNTSVKEKESFNLDFKKYQLPEINEKIVKATYKDIPLDYMSEDKNSEMKEQYLKSDVNFANYYIQVSTSCGTGCMSRYMIDTRTGDSYELPKLDNWEGNGNVGVLCSKNNSILIIQTDGSWSEDMETNSTGIWNWNENEKKFESVRLDEMTEVIN